MKIASSITSFIAIISLAACNLPGGQASPTATNIEVLPTETEVSLPTEPVSVPESTVTTGILTISALEAILIDLPGKTSVVTSPVTVKGHRRPTFEQNLFVAIYDEAGNQLVKTSTIIQADAGNPGTFSVDVSFSVDHEQAGRISVFETSARDGGILHLNSVDVILSPTGPANIIPSTVGVEDILILFPAQLSEVSSGTFTVSGDSDYYFEATLGMAICGDGSNSGGAPDLLCGDTNNVLARGTAMINSTEMGVPGPFSGTLTFSVPSEVQGRIVVFAASPRDGGYIHISAIPVKLIP